MREKFAFLTGSPLSAIDPDTIAEDVSTKRPARMSMNDVFPAPVVMSL